MNPDCLLFSQREKERESPKFSCEGVVRWCWIDLQCRGMLLIWIILSRARAYCAGGCLDIFLSSVFSFSLFGRWPDID